MLQFHMTGLCRHSLIVFDRMLISTQSLSRLTLALLGNFEVHSTMHGFEDIAVTYPICTLCVMHQSQNSKISGQLSAVL